MHDFGSLVMNSRTNDFREVLAIPNEKHKCGNERERTYKYMGVVFLFPVITLYCETCYVASMVNPGGVVVITPD